MGTKIMDSGALLTKWSSKPPDHKTKRVRDNQRRHREKVKRQITNLESQLAQTELALTKALCTIGQLKCSNTRLVSELQRLSGSHTANISVTANEQAEETDDPDGTRPRYEDAHDLKAKFARMNSESHNSPVLGSIWTEETRQMHDAVLDVDEKASSNLKPPEADETITRCRDAYRLVADLNYAGLEPVALRALMEPGFRGLSAEEGTCGIENKWLFAVLDKISLT